MPDRLEAPWIDVLAGRADAASATRVAESLAHDPVAVEAFEGWRRLATAVRSDAAARTGGLPPLAGVLAAIRTPAGLGEGPTALDRMGRATLRRLAAAPIVAAGAPAPVPAWVIGAAAAAAVVVFALWPTPRGPLGSIFVAAVRQHAARPALVVTPVDPTPVARLRGGADRLRVGEAAAASATRRAVAGERFGIRTGTGVDDAQGDSRPAAYARGPAGAIVGPRRTTGPNAPRTAAQRSGAVGSVGSGGADPAPGYDTLGTDEPGGYPGPQALASAYPPPSAREATGRGGEDRRPSKPPATRSPAPTPPPTHPPATDPPPSHPPATATPDPSAVVSHISGHVYGMDGGGRAQVRVGAYRRDDGPVRASWIETFTADASGRYTLTLTPGSWQLYAEAPGHRPQWWQSTDRPEGAQSLDVAIGREASIDWQLATTGVDDGLLVGEASPHAWVRAVPEGADPMTAAGPSALADGSGHFALPLPAGRWAIARADDGRDRGWRALTDPVAIVAGTSTTVAWP